ncbi:sodium:calcium antiporter [Patescibacteria group bacterium]|nr:sodium:calcium antiporter [Patescibacteria group bacterium]
MIILLLVFLLSFFFLVRSSALLVSSLAGLARLFRLSEYLVAFLLMSFATSVSELFVGISSATGGIPALSLGNILGANLLNLTVVIGVVALLHGSLEVESKISRQNFWFIFFLSLLPLLLGLDGIISRADGLVLLVSFFVYIWHILGGREYFTRVANHHPKGLRGLRKTTHDLLYFAAAITLLLVSSAALVWSGKALADHFSVGLLSFGIIFVALGTTLPELTFGIRAALSKHGSMTVGNALGSIAFNATFIIGLVSVIHPIVIGGMEQFFFVIGAFVIAFILFNIFVYRRTNITRKEGVILLAIYIAFLVLESLF